MSSKTSTTPIKVLLMENISQTAIDAFKGEGYIVKEAVQFTEDELIEELQDVHVIGVRSKTKLTERVLRAAPKLQAVGCFCIGTDQTDLKVASSLAIPVFNAPYANTRSVSELVLANIIMLARQATDRSREVHSGEWNKVSKGCYEIRGKTLGVVGYGHVGSQLSVIAEALGMGVVFYDIIPKLALGNARQLGSLDDLLAEADYVTLHVPAEEGTENMIGADQIAKMKKGSYLINYARGKVVDIEAAAAALRSGHLAGGAFDVFPTEPAGHTKEFKMALQGCPNTILTPHIGGSTEEAQSAIGIEVANKLIDFINKGSTISAVNLPEVAINRPLAKSNVRALHFHKNQPGVLSQINKALDSVNIAAQTLDTSGDMGYMIVEIESDTDAVDALKSVEGTVRCRVLYSGPNYRGEKL